MGANMYISIYRSAREVEDKDEYYGGAARRLCKIADKSY